MTETKFKKDWYNKKFYNIQIIDYNKNINKYLDKINDVNKILIYKCDCGHIGNIDTISIITEDFKSCGCKGYGEIPGEYWIYLKNSASKRNKQFNITIKYINDLYLKQNKKCNISGLSIDFAKNRTASLDRIINHRGYIQDNVEWVTTFVNMMKGQYNKKIFIDRCKLITNFNN